MLAILLMVVGGLMIFVSILGCLAILFQPLYEDYQVVIKRRDDYTHYLSPSGQAYLRSRIKRYWRSLGILFIAGTLIFFTGYYMKYGSRGFNNLLTFKDETNAEDSDGAQENLSKKLDENGDYISDSGVVYYGIVVRGNEVIYRNEPIGDVDTFREYIENLQKQSEIDENSKFQLLDEYASSAAYLEVMNILNEREIDYEAD
ncbi:MAG: hypothetical protein K5894_08095 [Lachnospiraceae bacterium]|nr:hypothetical protein [Lachnospiraceae bacterium]